VPDVTGEPSRDWHSFLSSSVSFRYVESSLSVKLFSPTHHQRILTETFYCRAFWQQPLLAWLGLVRQSGFQYRPWSYESIEIRKQPAKCALGSPTELLTFLAQ